MVNTVNGEALRPAKLVGTTLINGSPVSFFTPPHNEPDFLWVDFEELALAFLPEVDAKRFVQFAHNFSPRTRTVTTAVNGDRIATIAPHPMAQAFASFIDQRNGQVSGDREDWNDGPAHQEYCSAAADLEHDHGVNNSFETITAAFKNQGGPFMREFE
ncbi:hypothetical protein [Rhizobium sp. Rhizsp82]|uniref:hypothetical protein n=1 Tax=Rhizobium sp. Rhizsp82 TaxID=3243057 RepID=UPI0039B5DAA2